MVEFMVEQHNELFAVVCRVAFRIWKGQNFESQKGEIPFLKLKPQARKRAGAQHSQLQVGELLKGF